MIATLLMRLLESRFAHLFVFSPEKQDNAA